MPWQLFISGFVLGIFSSFHCIGMCGPIALLLPVQGLSASRRFTGTLLYNFGRVFTYSIMGCFLGIVGRRIYLAGFQQPFSIIMGILILVLLTLFILNKRFFHNGHTGIVFTTIKTFIGKQLRHQHMVTLFLIGTANGLLPCGMVYFALIGALATGNVANASLFMAAFGLGTIPLMMLLSRFGRLITAQLRNKVKTIIPFFVATMAILLILRGMNLDIPYISPFFNSVSGEAVRCHS